MPIIEESLAHENLVRVLCYGQALTRKTTWALKAAEAGFNVIYFGFDHNFQVATQLSAEAKKRVYHLDMRPPEDAHANSGALTLVQAAKPAVTFFDEEARQYVPMNKLEPETQYLRLDLTKVTPADIIVIDSWTAFVMNLAIAQRPVLDVKSVPKLEWDDYAKVRLLLDLFIKNVSKLNCHLIVIGHAEVYARRRKDADPKATGSEAIEQIRTQPSSISQAHASTLAKEFTDVLFFETQNAMVGPRISTRGSVDFDAGSRLFPPFDKKWEEFQFVNLLPPEMLAHAAKNAGFSSEALYTAPGSEFKTGSGSSATINVGKAPTILKV